MIYKWPGAVLKDMEKCIQNFLWTGNIDQKKLITTSRNKCCLKLEEGGLGIKSLSSLNKALFHYLVLKFMSSPNHAFSFLCNNYVTKLGV